jgi:hypothetical protein
MLTLFFLNLKIIRGVIARAIKAFALAAQKSGPDEFTPILSKVEVMAQISETVSIYREPFDLIISLKGERKPLLFLLKYNIYEPTTMSSTPTAPQIVGISFSISGDEISRKRGVNAISGATSDKSELLRARMYKIVDTTLSAPPAKRAYQKLLSIFGKGKRKTRGTRIGKE